MQTAGSRFRAVETRDHRARDLARVAAYRLDPSTLDFAEVDGGAERLLGFPVEEWCRPGFWHGRLHPQDREAVRAYFARWTSARRDGELEYRVIDASGRTVWVRQTIDVDRDRRHGDAVTGVLLDVSEPSCEAEAAKALTLRKELFRILAEELAPPLRAISVHAELLERHLAVQRDDVGSDYAVVLRDGVQRLDGTLIQLMRAAKNGSMTAEEFSACLAGLGASRRGD